MEKNNVRKVATLEKKKENVRKVATLKKRRRTETTIENKNFRVS